MAACGIYGNYHHLNLDEHGLHLQPWQSCRTVLPGKYRAMVRKATMKQTLLILVASIAGFCGGILATRVTRTAEKEPQEVVRARSFELTDAAGKTISFWGINDVHEAVLA